MKNLTQNQIQERLISIRRKINYNQYNSENELSLLILEREELNKLEIKENIIYDYNGHLDLIHC